MPVPVIVGVVSVVVAVVPAAGLVRATLEATHVCEVVLHVGVEPEQSLFALHCTITSVAMLVAPFEVAVTGYVLYASAVAGVHVHVPADVTVAVQSVVVPEVTVTV